MIQLSKTLLFEDAHLVAINKPAGLLSIPDRAGKEESLKGFLKAKYGDIFTVHRLDRDTSGVVVFAKTAEAHKALSEVFSGRTAKKIYNGLVWGKPPADEGSIDAPLMEHPVQRGKMVTNKKGKTALTDYKLLEHYGTYSWMEFQIHTGRTHQIRVHCRHIGNPIVCDELYGDDKPVLISSIVRKYKLSQKEDEERPVLNRLALHALRLSFTIFEKNYSLEAPIPKDLRALLQQLEKAKR